MAIETQVRQGALAIEMQRRQAAADMQRIARAADQLRIAADKAHTLAYTVWQVTEPGTLMDALADGLRTLAHQTNNFAAEVRAAAEGVSPQ